MTGSDLPELLLSRPGARVLLAGSGSYAPGSALTPVPAVARTVADLGRCLVEQAGLAESGLTTLVDPADPKELGAALAAAADAAEDVLICYYVGHGLVGPNGDLHLATRATMAADDQALPYATVADVLAGCRAPLVLVVLDCCFADRATGVRLALDEVFTAAQHGSYVLSVSGRDEVAWAPEGQRHTAFSGALIQVLTRGDPAAGPFLGVDDVYMAVTRLLVEQRIGAPRRQSGWPAGVSPLALNAALSGSGGFSPYRGLASYGSQDAPYFFGRADLTRNLTDRVAGQLSLREPLIVVGPSGAGKTSLLRAGLVPVLERASGTHVMVLTPGRDPIATLADELAAQTDAHPADLRQDLHREPHRLEELLAGPGQRVIVVDQFEELFTLCEEEAARRAFLSALEAACAKAVVVIGLRADFFGRCVRYDELTTALESPVIVTPMTATQLREAIERPAELADLTLHRGLADLLLADLAAGGPDGVLPRLSHALLATWQHREDGVLTVGGYLATGGIAHALANSAEATLAGLDPAGRHAARRLLPRLVRPGEGAGDTRTKVPLAELETSETGPVLEAFVKARLLTVGAETVELGHEALIRAWPRLGEWIDADRAALLARRQLDHRARDWAEHGEDPALLGSGDPEEFEHLPPLSDLTRRFQAASLEAHGRAAEARWRARATTVVAALLALVLIGFVAFLLLG